MKPKKRVAIVIVVLVTCGSKREAEKIARTLVKKGSAACGNVLFRREINLSRGKGKSNPRVKRF